MKSHFLLFSYSYAAFFPIALPHPAHHDSHRQSPPLSMPMSPLFVFLCLPLPFPSFTTPSPLPSLYFLEAQSTFFSGKSLLEKRHRSRALQAEQSEPSKGRKCPSAGKPAQSLPEHGPEPEQGHVMRRVDESHGQKHEIAIFIV